MPVYRLGRANYVPRLMENSHSLGIKSSLQLYLNIERNLIYDTFVFQKKSHQNCLHAMFQPFFSPNFELNLLCAFSIIIDFDVP